jgi:4-amino-4-deoxy-L-arabinose transferase-like glycosyltransferase
MSAHFAKKRSAVDTSSASLPQSADVRKTLFAIMTLVFTTCGMLAWTWMAWADAVVDFGREVYVPWRLYHGDCLYRDLAYFNGPLSPHVNLGVFSILGPSITSLFVANFLFHVATAVLIYALVRFITNVRCSLFCVFVFELLFAYAHYVRIGNYNYMAPYSHELTHGILLSFAGLVFARYWITTRKLRWSVAAGVALGLVFLTKPEIFLAIALAWTIALVLVGLRQDCPWATIVPAGLGLIGSAGLVFIVAVSLLRSCLPWHDAIYYALGGWPHVFNRELTAMPFYQTCTGFDFPLRRLATMILWLIVQLLLVRFALREALPARPDRSRKADFFLLIIVMAILLADPQSLVFLHAFSSLPLWLAAVIVIGLYKLRHSECERGRDKLVMGVVFASLGLALLAKTPLNARIYHYGFALAMPGTLAMIMVCWWIAHEVRQRGGSSLRFTIIMAGFLAFVSACHLGLMGKVLSQKGEHIKVADSPQLRASVDRARVFNSMLAHIEDKVAEEQTLAVWPEGALVNFLAQRPNSTAYPVLMPPEILMFGEDTILDNYRQSPPDYVLLVHHETSEYGVRYFGTDYAQELWEWLWQTYVPVVGVGETPFTSDEFGMLLLRRKASVDSTKSG